MINLSDIKQPVWRDMENFEKYFRQLMKSDIPLLSFILNYILRHKGKQIRPLFVFLTAGACGKITDSTYTAASMIELLHTATLVHDDVVDHSFERRNTFSIHALWRSKIAVLVGDYLLSRGLLIALEKKEFTLLEIVSNAVKEMSEGELLQVKSSFNKDITQEKYFEIISKKTASLIAACTACGAYSAGADLLLADRMKSAGRYIGIAFQIKDDLFDYTTGNITGKTKGNDIKEEKFTLPLIYALENASHADRVYIKRLLSKNKKADRKKLVQFVRERNGVSYAIDKMNEYKNKGLAIISELAESEAKSALIQLIEFSIERSN